jgi:hypothetical protein
MGRLVEGHARGNLVGRLEVLALVLIAVLLVVGALSTRGVQATPPAQLRLEVQPGDTLWSLAAAHPIEGLSTAELADVLARENHLGGRIVTAGQSIHVPATPLAQSLASR